MKTVMIGHALEGILQQPVDDYENQYAIQNIDIRYVPSKENEIFQQFGASGNKFALESFMDEIAQISQTDPIELRAKLLKHNKRALKVLEETKIHSKWGNPQKGNFQGFAYADSLNCIQAQVAEISINGRR